MNTYMEKMTVEQIDGWLDIIKTYLAVYMGKQQRPGHCLFCEYEKTLFVILSPDFAECDCNFCPWMMFSNIYCYEWLNKELPHTGFKEFQLNTKQYPLSAKKRLNMLRQWRKQLSLRKYALIKINKDNGK